MTKKGVFFAIMATKIPRLAWNLFSLNHKLSSVSF